MRARALNVATWLHFNRPKSYIGIIGRVLMLCEGGNRNEMK